MIKKLIILLLVLFLSSFAFADNVLEDFNEQTESIDQYMEKTIPVLNEELRKLRKRTDADTDELVAASSGDTAGYLDAKVKNSIEVDSNDLQLVGDETTPTNGKFYGKSGGNKGWFTPSGDTNLSNVIYCWEGMGDGSGDVGAGSFGIILTDTQTDVEANINKYFYMLARGTTYKTVLESKYKHSSDVSTLTVYCSIWNSDANAGRSAVCQVDIGSGTTGSVTGTGAQKTPEWKNFTIDVSGLSDGTVYSLEVQLKHNNQTDQRAYLDSIIIFAS